MKQAVVRRRQPWSPVTIMEPDSQFIDLVYEAALVPDLWPRVLEAASVRLGSVGGLLFTGNGGGWTCSAPVHDTFQRIVDDGWLARNSRLSRSLAAGLGHKTVTDFDIFDAEEMARDPLYQELRRKGWGWFVGMAVRLPQNDVAVFSFERAFAADPYDPATVQSLERMRAHLDRATLLTSRLGFERCAALTETLARVGLPAAVLGRGGRLLAANLLFENLMPGAVVSGRTRLHLTDAAANGRFAAALRALDLGLTQATSLSIPLKAREASSARIVHLLPIRGSAHDLFTGATCLVTVTPARARAAPDAALLGHLFAMSSRETALALAIAGGETPTEYAARNGTSANTVKSQLKRVFEKAGVRRQAELVALLVRLAGP